MFASALIVFPFFVTFLDCAFLFMLFLFVTFLDCVFLASLFICMFFAFSGSFSTNGIWVKFAFYSGLPFDDRRHLKPLGQLRPLRPTLTALVALTAP